MNRNDIAIESFISYCDEMMIAEEGMREVGRKIKDFLIKLFEKLISAIRMRISKIKNSKMKRRLQELLIQSKSGHTKAKNMTEGDQKTADVLRKQVEENFKVLDQMDEEIKEEFSELQTQKKKFQDDMNQRHSELKDIISTMNKNINDSITDLHSNLSELSKKESTSENKTYALSKLEEIDKLLDQL